MTTYAMVREGLVLSHFTTDRPLADFADIQEFLVEAPKEIQDGMVFDGKVFSILQPAIEPPSELELLKQRVAILEASIK